MMSLKYLSIFFIFLSVKVNGQILSAEVKANGLVCSLCSRSIEMSLMKLDFIEKVEVDLQNTTTLLSFKAGKEVDIGKITRAVEKAGFSVGSMKIEYRIPPVSDNSNGCIAEGPIVFQLLNHPRDQISGIVKFIVIGPEFMAKEDFRSWEKKIPEPCTTDEELYYVEVQ